MVSVGIPGLLSFPLEVERGPRSWTEARKHKPPGFVVALYTTYLHTLYSCVCVSLSLSLCVWKEALFFILLSAVLRA